MKLKCSASVVALILSATSRGDQVSMSFDDQRMCVRELVQSGLRITNGRGTICFQTSGYNTVSNGTTSTNDVRNLKIVHVEGDVFTPIRVDLAEYSIHMGAAEGVRFVGRKQNGDTVEFSVTLDGIADGPGGVKDFQTVVFPPEFVNITSLDVPSWAWSLDNLVIDTVPPPPLPTDQRLEPTFSSAQLLREGMNVVDNVLIIGSDFDYTSGFHRPRSVVFLDPGGFSFSASAPYYDKTTGSVVHSHGIEIRQTSRAVDQRLVTVEQLRNLGFPINSLANPVLRGGRLVFEGYDWVTESYYIFESSSGFLSNLVGPTTPLPDTAGGSSFGLYFPSNRAIGDNAFAFDTAFPPTASEVPPRRVFVKRGTGNFSLVVSQGDSVPLGTVASIEGLAFDANNHLLVDVMISGLPARLRYDSSGLIEAKSGSVVVTPVNAGLTVREWVETTVSGKCFIVSDGVLYRERGGEFYKVIGVGDTLAGRTIRDLRYLGAPETGPERVIVDVAFEPGSYQRKHYLITLDEPKALPPRFGNPFFYPRNRRLYVPLSHLTAGRSYAVESSPDLERWSHLRDLDQITPLQFMIIRPPHPEPGSFYRVREIRR